MSQVFDRAELMERLDNDWDFLADTVEMLVGRLGMPDTGGSYFTFSNENNDDVTLDRGHDRRQQR